jgi:sigma-B regulation protein RsbU (phosphoserine phosphatase)
VQISIRWKLILAIGVPLLTVYLVVLWIDYAKLKASAYERLQQRAAERAESFAAQFDGQFEMVAQVAKSTAEFITLHPEMTEERVYALLRANVERNPLIYGSCVAFEPYASDQNRKLTAPYVHRGPKGLVSMDLAREAYDYTEPEWAWYALPKESGGPIWTDPYFDEGAGNILMCTYSAPFFQAGVLRGVATVDIPVEQLRQRVGLMELEQEPFALISRTGTFITHPDPSVIMRETVFSIAEKRGSSELVELFEQVRSGESGVRRVAELHRPEPFWVSYAPIPSAGWYFAAAIAEAEAMAEVRSSLYRATGIRLFGLVLILVIVLVVSVRITRPIQQLAASIGDVASGNFETQVTGIESRDEVGALAKMFNVMVKALKAHMRALTKATAEREAVESELRVARQIQASLLPRCFPPFPDHAEFALHATNKPAKRVAGDFFDFFFLDDHVLAVVMADVSGKGVPAALFMAVTRTLVRNLALSGLTLTETLDRANKTLIEDNDECLFVTLFLGHYDTRTGRLTFANAGHNPPYRVDGGGTVYRFPLAGGMPLGFERSATFEEDAVMLDHGDLIVLYTDGVTEACSPSGEMFSDHRFEALLAKHAGEPVEKICRIVDAEVDAYRAHEGQDDITLLALRRNG